MSLYNSLKQLYATFPRQCGTPQRKDIQTFDELIHFIDLYNGTERVYTSVLSYTYKNKSPQIDRIVFDLDHSDDMLGDVNRFYDWCVKHHYISTMVFSGGGFHFYIFADGSTTNKLNMARFQRKAIKESKVPFDTSVVGDLARICGTPGTYNTRRGRYVVFLNERDITKDMEHIYEKAKQQYSTISLFGSELVPISEFNLNDPKDELALPTHVELNFDGDKFLSAIPPCVAYLLKKGNPDHNQRGLILNYLITRGYTRDMIVQLLKKYLNEEKFNHCVQSESVVFKGKRAEDQISYMMRKYQFDEDWFFNSCSNIEARGWCVCPKCPFWDKRDTKPATVTVSDTIEL